MARFPGRTKVATDTGGKGTVQNKYQTPSKVVTSNLTKGSNMAKKSTMNISSTNSISRFMSGIQNNPQYKDQARAFTQAGDFKAPISKRSVVATPSKGAASMHKGTPKASVKSQGSGLAKMASKLKKG